MKESKVKTCPVCRKRVWFFGVDACGMRYHRECAGYMMELFAVRTGSERHEAARELIPKRVNWTLTQPDEPLDKRANWVLKNSSSFIGEAGNSIKDREI